VSSEHDTVVNQAIQQLSARRNDALITLEMLRAHTQQVEEQASLLENPQAITDYVAFFAALVTRAADDCARIAAELTTEGARAEHVQTLRRLAGDSMAEQRRCLQFRDKWINKPLPHEKMRPMLNDISVTTRDQLTAFRDLTNAADRLETVLTPETPPPPPDRTFDRRSLFTRFIKRD
jgi:hypothetical protein